MRRLLYPWSALLAVALALWPVSASASASCSGLASQHAVMCAGAGGISSGGVHRLQLRGGGNALGANGEAITEEQAGEELIKAAAANNIAGLDPAGLNLLIQSGAPVNYQVSFRAWADLRLVCVHALQAPRELVMVTSAAP
jgi:hypothetical protein